MDVSVLTENLMSQFAVKKWNGSDSSSDFDLITQNSTFVYLKLGFALNIDRVGIIVPLEPFLWVQFNDPERLLVSLYF